MPTPARVESLSYSGLTTIPKEYVRPESERENLGDAFDEATKLDSAGPQVPIVDLAGFDSTDEKERAKCVEALRKAAEDWGVMHIVNHGIAKEVIQKVREAGKAFFDLPVGEKEKYANDQESGDIQGYGSKLANNECGQLEWQDYFFHLIFPEEKTNLALWPKQPAEYTFADGQQAEGRRRWWGDAAEAQGAVQQWGSGLGREEEAEACGQSHGEADYAERMACGGRRVSAKTRDGNLGFPMLWVKTLNRVTRHCSVES